jgi:hypothetical protein
MTILISAVITAIVAQLLAGKTETDQVLKEAFKRAEKLVPDTDQLRALRSYVFDYNIADMKLSEASSLLTFVFNRSNPLQFTTHANAPNLT